MIIRCPKCNAKHPEYFSACPKCDFERHSSKKDTSNETTNQIPKNEDSLNIFDFSFSTFTTPLLLKVVYLPIIVLSTIALAMGILTIIQFIYIYIKPKMVFQRSSCDWVFSFGHFAENHM